MSNLFKDIYSKSFYEEFSQILAQTLPVFDKEEFNTLIFNDAFAELELKERMTHTATVLHHFLPADFGDAAETIKQIIDNLRSAGIREKSIEYMFFPEYIAMYGIDDYENSIAALEYVTQFTSCEFAVRPYIVKYQDKMLKQMLSWSTHDNNKVRRLASEGARPRLPWAMALPSLKKDPNPIGPILDNLKNDSCEVVRRSAANNLNDISKDNPEFVISRAKEWLGSSKETDALIKHACRTLLKQGNPDVLQIFGFDSTDIELFDFRVTTPAVQIGDQLEFTFSLLNRGVSPTMLRLEYGLYYKKHNGDLSRKVFKISERELEPGRIYDIKRKQSFKPITTRKLYIGTHQVSIILNGKENKRVEFELMV
ncbi:DNA alkylation repair protein [Photobacterium proteolyticum]|uniref:DNA alkylation repair protein n=1 Tax=Photobacterium proteolyticum TaxID=1903952 RepID=A0A1Q9GIU7_9GAMM|nr:DNA alkylation repair protein [Photobacterium proteolyticum]OLQ74379.1 DNA alkylation repair protein [Photobacterium proteolyticum]